MTRYIRDLRLIPIALIASACLLVLQIANLTLDGGRWFAAEDAPATAGGATIVRASPDEPQQPDQRLSWAQRMFNFQAGSNAATSTDMALTPAQRAEADRASAQASDPDITGSIDKPAKPAAAGAKTGKGAPPPPAIDGIVIPTDGANLPTGAERAILERLQKRREELDERARALDIRENMVHAAEERIDAHLAEIKEIEARINVETQQKDKAESARFKGLVTMYENMKPADAAKIFDGLDMDVLIKVVSQINPRAMADIMAQMSPQIAERLTVELATRAQTAGKSGPAELPKINGTPTSH